MALSFRETCSILYLSIELLLVKTNLDVPQKKKNGISCSSAKIDNFGALEFGTGAT